MLESVDPGFGIEVVTLAAAAVETLPEREIRLETIGEIAAEDGIAPLVDRLANRLGEDRVWRSDALSQPHPRTRRGPPRPVRAKLGRGDLGQGSPPARAPVRPARADRGNGPRYPTIRR